MNTQTASRSRRTIAGRPRPASSRSAATRRRLLDAAAHELVAGDGRLEIAAVAARAGASVGLSYHHFGSKAGLLAAIVEDFYDRYDAAIIDLNPLPGGDWAARERCRLELLVAFMLTEPLAGLILARLSAEPEVAAVEARRLARHIELGARNIALAQRRGHLPQGRDPRLLVAMIMGGLRQAVGQVLAHDISRERAGLTQELWNFITSAAGLSAPPGADARRSEEDHAQGTL